MDIDSGVRALEASIFDPVNLPKLLDDVTDALELQAFHITNAISDAPLFLHCERTTEGVTDYFRRDMAQRDTWIDGARNWLARGNSWVFDHEIIPQETRAKDEYYSDFCPKHSVAHHAFYNVDPSRPGFGLSFMRSAEHGDFEPELRTRLHTFVGAASRVATFLSDYKLNLAKSMLDAIAGIGTGAVLLDDLGRVVCLNAEAEGVFNAEFGVRARQIWTADPEANKALRRLLRSTRDQELDAFPDIIVRRPLSGLLILSPIRVRGAGLDVFPGARLLLTLKDLSTPKPPARELLIALFDLTPREADVACRLAVGETTEVISSKLGLKASTVIQHIKMVLAKSGCRSRPAFIAKVGCI